jgi:hypothetical protein
VAKPASFTLNLGKLEEDTEVGAPQAQNPPMSKPVEEEKKERETKPPTHKNLLELASAKSRKTTKKESAPPIIPPLSSSGSAGKPVIPALKINALKIDGDAAAKPKPQNSAPKSIFNPTEHAEMKEATEEQGELTKLEKSLNKNSKMQLFSDMSISKNEGKVPESQDFG